MAIVGGKAMGEGWGGREERRKGGGGGWGEGGGKSLRGG